MRRSSVTMSISLAALALLAGACASSGVSDRSAASQAGSLVAFRSIAQGDPPRADSPRPVVYVALKAYDLGALEDFLFPADRERVATTDLSASALIAVFGASVGSSGRAITVQRISIAGGELRIVAESTGPAPTEYALSVFTTPYQVIEVGRSEVVRPGVSSWVLLDPAGHVLARGSIGG